MALNKRFVKKGESANGQGVPEMGNGQQWDVKAMQDFNRRSIYMKGFSFTTQAGSNNNYNIQLGGLCRQLYGIIMFFPTANVNDDDTMSLSINQETILDEVNWKSFSPAASGNTFKPKEYFKIKRGLSGNDTVKLNINAVGGHAFYIMFYLSASAQPEIG